MIKVSIDRRLESGAYKYLIQYLLDLEAGKTFTKVPDAREYFSDLDYVLGVISDGPTKSFAFRRLRYLESKWNLYVLLNEYQELAESKVLLNQAYSWYLTHCANLIA